MKSSLLFALLFQLAIVGMAQTSKLPNTLKKTKNPLPDEAFDQMIVQDITYAIIGESTPTNGLKIDVSKPEGTISGVFRPKNEKTLWSLWGFDLKGGVTDKNFSLFKGLGSANSAYEFKPTFYFIPYKSTAYFGWGEEAKRNKRLVVAKNHLDIDRSIRLIDTFYIISRINQHHFAALKLPPANIAGASGNDSVYRQILFFFVKKITSNNDLVLGKYTTLDDLLRMVKQVKVGEETDMIVPTSIIEEVPALYKKYAKLYEKVYQETVDKMIVNASEIWTKKFFFWWSLSPHVKTEKVNEYYTKFGDMDSSYFKSDYHYYYGLSGNLNWYILRPNKDAHFVRGALSLSRGNNLTTLSSYNYETRSPIFSNGNMVTEKSKTGAAYNHGDFKSGFMGQLAIEYYYLPINTLIPGGYFSTNSNISNLYNLTTVKGREKDALQVGIEAGAVFNITNREKDKERSILSILAYIRHEDLTDSRRISTKTGIEESRDDFRKRNISIGLKVGIPINLPQRSK